MSFCSNCGTQFDGNACPKCGTFAQQPQQPVYQQPQQPVYQQPQQPVYQQPQQPVYQQAQAKPGKGFAVAALVMAIIAVLTCFSFMYSLVTYIEPDSFEAAMDAVENLDDLTPIEGDFDDLATGLSVNAIFWAIFAILGLVFAHNAKKKGFEGGMIKAANIMCYIAIALTVVSIGISFSEFG